MTIDTQALRGLLAREAIRDCMARYARAIDRVDRALLTNVYWPEANDNHGNFNGSAADFIEWVIPLLEGMEQTMHFLGNQLIELDEDCCGARSETYFEAYHRIPHEGAEPQDVIVAGRYVDRFEAREGQWRIRDREVIYDWAREYLDSADWSQPVLGLTLRSNRKGTDRSYALLYPEE